MRDEPWRRDRVRELSRTFRAALRDKGLSVNQGDSPIVPIIVGSESAAMEMSERLLEKNCRRPRFARQRFRAAQAARG